MTDKTTATAPAIAPDLPNASIDMNKLLANDADGKTGLDVLHDAILVQPAGTPTAKADQPADRTPQAGDTVTREEGAGGWNTITASWLVDPIKVQGDPAATAKVEELRALIPGQNA